MTWRLFLTAWLVYSLHFATNIVREHYPAFSLAERGTLRVDPYLGLHPDLFELPGRGVFINNNPGASLLAAPAYALVRPAIDLVVARVQARRAAAGGELSADYDDPRPNRRHFFAQVRERGLDVRFGLAAFAIQLLCTAPLTAGGVVAMHALLRRLGAAAAPSVALALLYAFGTPVFFRAAFLNQNLFVCDFALFALLLALPRAGEAVASPPRLVAAGLCAGVTLLCDYSGVVVLLALGAFVAQGAMRALGPAAGLRRSAALVAGMLPPVLALLAYQAWAFGNPLYPAQRYMPETELSGQGWRGMSFPAMDLLLQNLVDPRFGLFAFAPILALAFAAPLLGRARPRLAHDPLLVLCYGFFVALLLFASANQYGRLQFNTGVRYLVPAVPFLFLPLADVLLRLPRQLALLLGALALAFSWCLAMVREDVPLSLTTVFVGGLRLPWLTVLGKMGGQYVGLLAGSAPDPLPLFLLAGGVLAILWWPARAGRP
ncbi:MAG TPA: hypothetical protein VMW35_22575 [Myxococcota bacterium]|nr:hypothetical protein [Myxococcota bacterium]